MYFSHANYALPILHTPTFRPTADNRGLLLSICSVGCLFIGTSQAARYGSVLFEKLLRAMMTKVRALKPRNEGNSGAKHTCSVGFYTITSQRRNSAYGSTGGAWTAFWLAFRSECCAEPHLSITLGSLPYRTLVTWQSSRRSMAQSFR